MKAALFAACVLGTCALAADGGGAAASGSPSLSSIPAELAGVPGQPLVLVLEARFPGPRAVRFRLPPAALLHLRATETIPVVRDAGGGAIYRRRLIFQGLEPGEALLDGFAVEADGAEWKFPPVRVRVLAAEGARR
jgi:hypothetical protein